MAVQLQKGGNVSLSRVAPSLKRIHVGLGWDARSSVGAAFDLDASVFMLGSDGRVLGDDHFIFYHQTKSPCGSVMHTGDNQTGDGDGDDESVHVDLDKVPANVQKLAVTVTIYDAGPRRQNFGQVEGASIRIVDRDTDVEIARFDLSEDYSTETAMIFGEIYRHSGEWKFKAVGQGMSGGLEALCRQYGVNLA